MIANKFKFLTETFKSLSLYSKEMAKEQEKKEASQDLDTDKLLQEIEELAGKGKSASVPKLEEIKSTGSVEGSTEKSDLEAQLLEVQQENILENYKKLQKMYDEVLNNYTQVLEEKEKLQEMYSEVSKEKAQLLEKNKQLSDGTRRAVEVARIAKTKADKLETDYKNLENENKGLKDKYTQLEDRNKNLENQLATLEEKHKELETEYNSLKQQYEAEKQQFEGKVKELEDKIKNLGDQVKAKDSEIKKIEDDYKSQLEIKIDANKKLEEKINSLKKDHETQLEKLNEQLRVQGEEYNKLKEKYNELINTNYKISEELKKTEESLEQAKKLLIDRDKKLDQIKQTVKKLEKYESENQELHKKCNELEEKYKALQPLETLEKNVMGVSKKLESIQKAINDVSEYKISINNLKTMLEESSKISDEVKKLFGDSLFAKINEGYEKIKTLHNSLGLAGEPKLEDFGNESYVNELLSQLDAKKAKLEKDYEDTKNILFSTIMQFIPQQPLAQSGELEKKVQQPGAGTVAPATTPAQAESTPQQPMPTLAQENLEKKVEPAPTQPKQTSQYQPSQQTQQSQAQAPTQENLEKKVQQTGTGTVAPTPAQAESTPQQPMPTLAQENLEKKVEPAPTQPKQTSQYQVIGGLLKAKAIKFTDTHGNQFVVIPKYENGKIEFYDTQNCIMYLSDKRRIELLQTMNNYMFKDVPRRAVKEALTELEKNLQNYKTS